MHQNFAMAHFDVKLVLHDDRSNSSEVPSLP